MQRVDEILLESFRLIPSSSKRTAWFIFIFLVVLLIAGTTMPNDLKAEIEGRMWRKLPWSALAHYALFTLIGMCPVYGAGRAAVWRAIAVAGVLAVLTELLQSLIPGRHPQLRDVVIDLCGTASALLLVQVRRPPLTAT